jgi:hypothetical protein
MVNMVLAVWSKAVAVAVCWVSIIYLKPFSGRNLRAFGYDMYSEATRNAAMAQARDLGGLKKLSAASKVSGFIFKGGYFVLFDSASRQFDRPAGL